MEKLSMVVRIQSILHRTPNSRNTAQEFWEQMLLSLILRGNAFALIKRDTKGEVVALWPMSADQVRVQLLTTGDLSYEYSFDNKRLIYLESDVLHIRGPGNGAVGMSPLDHMRSSVGLAISTQNHTTKTFRKNARRPGILMSDVVLTNEQRAALKQNFGDIVAGKDKELYILEAQFKFEPLGMTPADLELLNSRKFAVQDLARWFGVPSVLINDTGESTALGSSTGQIIEAFFKLKLRPMLSRIESAIIRQVLSPGQRAKGYTVKFSFDAILRATLTDRMEVYAKAVQNGIKTRNEARALENDPPMDGGDELTVQSNLVPLAMLGEVALKGGDKRQSDESSQQTIKQ
jgi:HK97 family phage portal protein